jgi:uncharacterized membrane protein YfcA
MSGPAGLAGVFAIATLAGAIAAVAGFGIGSLLTPLFAFTLGTGAAVALATVPHAFGTALRAWRLRDAVSWRVLRSFGIASAIGGLAGALLQPHFGGRALGIVFGVLLIMSGASGLFRRTSRTELPPWLSLIGGALSGLFGGLVGNQGGIRSGTLLHSGLEPRALVATATMTALLVDAMRLPVYLAGQHAVIAAQVVPVAAATAGVLLGTVAGERVLRRMPERVFRVTVSLMLIALGVTFVGWGPRG